MNSAAIALGSNLGDRASHLASAVQHLHSVLTGLRVSSWHETAPVGVPLQPDFLNGAVVGETTLGPRALLERLLAIEQAHGRERPHEGAPRTLDVDLILYGGEVIDEPGLRVPHPRFRERRFVLEPLSEIASGWIDPVTGRSVGELLAGLLRARQGHGGRPQL
ncbi:MAG TPA: 2-amino-4-hydroxy-6-hydroxymethyldihydropteridine diphosphokinase [Vicinamibacterales bacterium]|nr:2-amino-4-hydroxy-6-hydroxymethyldihydropteridine diphosphokinase [Vicinamibacterales bacterium]